MTLAHTVQRPDPVRWAGGTASPWYTRLLTRRRATSRCTNRLKANLACSTVA